MKSLTPSPLLPLLLCLPATATATVLYSEGHGDLRIGYRNGGLTAGYHFDPGTVVDGVPVTASQGVDYDASQVITWIQDPAISSPPPLGTWSFLGSAAGQPIWVIPQTQSQDITKPWLGTNTENLTTTDWTGPLSITLKSITAPVDGYFSLFTSGAFGEPQLKFDTFDGLGADDVLAHPLGSHVHYNWLFTQPGLYEMTLGISGVHVTDGLRETSVTLTFGVVDVPEPGAAMLGGISGLLLLGKRRRA